MTLKVSLKKSPKRNLHARVRESVPLAPKAGGGGGEYNICKCTIIFGIELTSK